MNKNRSAEGRIVFTGFGAVGANGNSAPEIMSSIMEGRSPIKKLEFPDEDPAFAERLAVKIGGRTKLDTNSLSDKFLRRGTLLDRMVALALKELVVNAGLLGENGLVRYPEETGFMPGSGVGNTVEIVPISRMMDRPPETLTRIEQYQVNSGPLRYLTDQPVDKGTIMYGIQGYSALLVAACASTGYSIAEGRKTILDPWDDTQIAIVGGGDGGVVPLALHTFGKMGALSTNTERPPEEVSRPFDAERDGFVMSDGFIAASLESLDFAIARGANIRCELIGYAITTDAYEESEPSVERVAFTMNKALENARLTVSDIDLIVAHATSTKKGDRAEGTALKQVLGPDAQRIPVMSPKGGTGHYMGGAGGINLLVAEHAIRTGEIPYILNTTNPDGDAADLDLVLGHTRSKKVDTVMFNTFGFGGKNFAGIIRRFVQ